ncbi:LysR family transcriptional regulator [Burkholderia cepacia]|uniref:LysR family transcriptional regulator n=1 Tax=Burkholderia cepacia TaxID=292 RepID=UPI002AB70D42|nr:LysR family transcriptional regulator [Burkholderia cepacia]
MAIRYSLRQLEVFIAVASLGSFTAAAEELHTSRAALASTVDALEDAIGRQLFNRRRSLGITLTPAGKQLLNKAMALLHNAEQLAHTASGRTDLTGELVIGATMSLASSVVSVLMNRLAQAHPRLRIRVIVRGAEELASLLELGGTELLISYAATTAGQRVQTEPLFEARFGVIAQRGSFVEHSGAIPASALADKPLVILDNPLSRQRVFDYLGEAGAADVDVRFRVGSMALCVGLVRTGLARGLVPVFPVMSAEMTDDVECIHLTPPPMPITATVAWNQGVTLSPAAQAAVEELRALRDNNAW